MSTESSPPATEPASTEAHRSHVGPPEKYDLMAADQFKLLTTLGLREHHSLLDVGCGSLRAGRLFIPYLLSGRYFGIEPEEEVLRAGISGEIGEDLVRLREPTFAHVDDFDLTVFGRSFDFLLAQSIFSHATADQVRRCVTSAREVMHESSVFVATYIPGDADYDGDVWVYPGKVNFRPEFFQELAAEVGLAWQELAWTHANRQTWMVLHDPANEAPVPEAVPTTPLDVRSLDVEIKKTRRKLTSTRSQLETTRAELESVRGELQAARAEIEALRGDPLVRIARRVQSRRKRSS